MNGRLVSLGAVAAVLALPCAAAAQAPPPSYVHAHRGGPVLAGEHRFGEETLSAFRYAHLVLGSVVELDAKLTADGVPVVIHDATLDRTTPCTGLVRDKTLEELEACPVDVLGSPGTALGGAPAPEPEPIPTLEQALEFAVDTGATVNLEIKNIPNEPDFDPSTGFAERVMDVVDASGIAPDHLIVQSFWPPSLDVAKQRLPGVQTAFLTLGEMNEGGIPFATARGYDWVSPEWPVNPGYVQAAHAAGRKVVPYTLNTAADITAAHAAGVDAVITDDPLMARRALGIPDPPAGDTEGPAVELDVAKLASARFRFPTITLRWRGSDPSGVAGFLAQIRQVGTKGYETVWVGARHSARVQLEEGASYRLRVRAQDNAGNLGPFARGRFTVPFDQIALRLRGWRSVTRTNAWLKRVAQADGAGATATYRFTGRRVRLIGPRFATGGRLEVTVDGEGEVVSARGRGERKVLFDSGRLPKGRHTVRVRTLGGGPVALDAVAPS